MNIFLQNTFLQTDLGSSLLWRPMYRVSRPLSPPWGRNIGQLSLKIVYHLINYYMCAHFPQNMGPYHSKLHPQWSIKLDVLPDQKSDFSLILIIKINSIMRKKWPFWAAKTLNLAQNWSKYVFRWFLWILKIWSKNFKN